MQGLQFGELATLYQSPVVAERHKKALHMNGLAASLIFGGRPDLKQSTSPTQRSQPSSATTKDLPGMAVYGGGSGYTGALSEL
jgi:hypothetical protein